MTLTVVGARGDRAAMEPFIGSVSVLRGELTRRGLARENRAIYRDVYLPRDVDLTARLRARAAWLATGATLCGSSAAAVHGTKWLASSAPAEVVRSNRRSQSGIVVHTWQLARDETCVVGGMVVTTPQRTAFDIGRRCVPSVAVPLLDALLNATGITAGDVVPVVEAHPGARGVARLRRALALTDGGAESPQESRLRLLLVGGGLPVPETQIKFADLRIRIDMGWREWQVAVEYDGVQHWSDGRQRSWDLERIALLEEAGWIVIRVSAGMMARPDLIVERVRARLRSRGCLI